jgi:1L-myo-inositol 1-phosphate cytidylyltransferase / CDP-L-myo-inositol myo-inositolphosphotransferase
VIRRAYLVADRDAPPDRVIAGLSVLLRQALALQAAGIEEVVLVGIAARRLRADPRVRLEIREAAELPPRTDSPALLVPAGAVWNPAAIRRLVRSPAAPSLVPIGPGEAVLVPRTPADAAAATALLLGSLYKPTDGIISRLLNRRLSLAITRRLLTVRVTPNQITGVASLLGVAAAGVAYRGGYWNLLVGTMLFQAQSILDGCDGEIARLKYLHSRVGEWFDQIADDGLNTLFLLAVGAALARGGIGYAWPLAVVALVCQIVYVTALYSGLAIKAAGRGSVATLRWWVEGRGPSGPRSAARVIGDLTRRDFICFFYFACAAAGAIEAAFVWHAVVIVLSGVVTAVGWLVFSGPEVRAPDEH